MESKSNWITFIGIPNSGKSTLLNKLIGTKISIVSPKVQTTRTALKGIKMIDNTQLVFIDTPGIFQKAKNNLEKHMLQCAWDSLFESNHICVIMDCTRFEDRENQYLLSQLAERKIKVALILNKVDLIQKDLLLPITQKLTEKYSFEKIFMISALKEDGLADLENYFVEHAKSSPWYFDPEDITNAPMRFLIAETVREKIFFHTNQELPYNIAVETESYEETDRLVKINVMIKVVRMTHKKIIIGQGGSLLKQIGTKARLDMEKLIGKKVFLTLFVKVTDWSNDLRNMVGF